MLAKRIHYANLSQGMTEEGRRLLLLTGERHRKGAHLRQQPTDPLGLCGSDFAARFARDDPPGAAAPPWVTGVSGVEPEQAAAVLANIYLATRTHSKQPFGPAAQLRGAA